MAKRTLITAERLRELMSYDPDTGEMTRLIRLGGRGSVGQLAGHLDVGGYFRLRVDGKSYLRSRLAWLWMTGAWPIGCIDHRDGDTQNDKWKNLREATASQNAANRRRSTKNTSGFKGVSWVGPSNRWRVRINFEGKSILIGDFKEIDAAATAYEAASQKYHGEFARTG